MLRILVLVALSVSGAIIPCFATNPPPLATSSDPFDSYEKAARAALHVAMVIPESSMLEFCGAVLAIEGRFYFTKPVSSGSEHECTTHVPLPPGVSLAAIYHTHPQVTPILQTRALHNARQYFSRIDSEVARTLNVPSFIGLRWSEEIVVFEPPPRRTEQRRFTARIHK